MNRLRFRMRKAAIAVGGAYKTKQSRITTGNLLVSFLASKNIQYEEIELIGVADIESYFEARLTRLTRKKKKVSKRTLCNENAHIKGILIHVGRLGVANHSRLSNVALGISGGARKGTKLPISSDLFNSVLQCALLYDEGLAACMMLAVTLGLRSIEAVCASESLRTWKKLLSKNCESLPVTFGTKGGRPRNVKIHDRDAVQKAVDFACKVASKRGGRLIDRPKLETAMNYFRKKINKLGLKKLQTFHSLRYWFSVMALKTYLKNGFSKKEALALTSMDLGHGDGRGVFIKQVYVQDFFNSMSQEFVYSELTFFNPENVICDQVPLFEDEIVGEDV